MIAAIIQARMGSTRLPGKVLEDVLGHAVLWHVVNRVRHAHRVDRVVVATTIDSLDDPVVALCEREEVDCFRGSPDDVLDRYYHAATSLGADVIVRITADCPLMDPAVIDTVVHEYQRGGYDYVSNTLRETYPDGLDVEVVSFEALATAWREARQSTEREHVTPYIRASAQFRLGSVVSGMDITSRDYRWTVDTVDDLRFVREVYDRLGHGSLVFGMSEILALLEAHPDVALLNSGAIPNEGYYVSVARSDQRLEPLQRQLSKSAAMLERARALIPSQTQTFSKGPTQFVSGVSPAFLTRGKGSHVWDVDGNEYIDLIGALGPMVLGYDYPAVTSAVTRQIRDGVSFSLPHPLEVEVAELLVDVIPCAEMVRFGKNGSDVTAGAVRLARAATGRDKIACCGYHGWQDWYIGTTTRDLGVPASTQALTIPFEYNDLADLERVFTENDGEIAAVIMEPVGVIEPAGNYLHEVKQLAHRHGALLIFDEVVTGFRIAMGGAQAHYGVTPDLGCFGKAMANGFPMSALVGRSDIMKLLDEVFFSFTFGGEAVSLAAAKATITEMRAQDVIPYLWEVGSRLQDGYNVIAREVGVSDHTRCIGLPPHTIMSFDASSQVDPLLLRSLVQQELVKRGVLFLVGNNVSYSHTNADVEHTLAAYREALTYMGRAIAGEDPRSLLDGEPVQAVFRKP